MVCVLSRNRDSLWPRQEKPHLHPQVGCNSECACVCMCVCVLCLFKMLWFTSFKTPQKKKCVAVAFFFFYLSSTHWIIKRGFWSQCQHTSEHTYAPGELFCITHTCSSQTEFVGWSAVLSFSYSGFYSKSWIRGYGLVVRGGWGREGKQGLLEEEKGKGPHFRGTAVWRWRSAQG